MSPHGAAAARSAPLRPPRALRSPQSPGFREGVRAWPPPLQPALPPGRLNGCYLPVALALGRRVLPPAASPACLPSPARLPSPQRRSPVPAPARAASPPRMDRAPQWQLNKTQPAPPPPGTRLLPLAGPPARRTLTRSAIGRRGELARPTRGGGLVPFPAGTHGSGAGRGGEEALDYSPQQALRRPGALLSLASRGACGGALGGGVGRGGKLRFSPAGRDYVIASPDGAARRTRVRVWRSEWGTAGPSRPDCACALAEGAGVGALPSPHLTSGGREWVVMVLLLLLRLRAMELGSGRVWGLPPAWSEA